MDRYTVISADCHAGADLLDYRDYLDPDFRDEFDSWAKTYVNPFADLADADAERNWDSDRRNADLDAEGVAGEVIYPPNTIPPFFPSSSLAATPPETPASSNCAAPACVHTTAGLPTSVPSHPSGVPGGWGRSCSKTSTAPSARSSRSPNLFCAAVFCYPASRPARRSRSSTPSIGNRCGWRAPRRASWSTTTAATPDRARSMAGGAARSRYGCTKRTGSPIERCGT